MDVTFFSTIRVLQECQAYQVSLVQKDKAFLVLRFVSFSQFYLFKVCIKAYI